MSVDIWVTSTFARQLKKLKKENYPIHLITKCLKYIITNDTENRIKIKDHQLYGQWNNYREFHPARISNISGKEFDQWVVIYSWKDSKLNLTLVATGNHSIFNKLNAKQITKSSKYFGKI